MFSSKIGRSNKRSSLKNQENLQRAINEARKLVLHSPVKEANEFSPIHAPEAIDGSLKFLLNQMKQETKCFGTNKSSKDNMFLAVNATRSRSKETPANNDIETISLTVDNKQKRQAPKPRDPNPTITYAPPTPLPQRPPVVPAVPASPESYHGGYASTEQLITPQPEMSPRHRNAAKKKKGGWI